MHIKLTYMAQIKTIIGKSSERLECPDDFHAQDLILHLCQTYGNALKDALLDEQNRLRRVILVFVNDEQVSWEDNPHPQCRKLMCALCRQ